MVGIALGTGLGKGLGEARARVGDDDGGALPPAGGDSEIVGGALGVLIGEV